MSRQTNPPGVVIPFPSWRARIRGRTPTIHPGDDAVIDGVSRFPAWQKQQFNHDIGEEMHEGMRLQALYGAAYVNEWLRLKRNRDRMRMRSCVRPNPFDADGGRDND